MAFIWPPFEAGQKNDMDRFPLYLNPRPPAALSRDSKSSTIEARARERWRASPFPELELLGAWTWSLRLLARQLTGVSSQSDEGGLHTVVINPNPKHTPKKDAWKRIGIISFCGVDPVLVGPNPNKGVSRLEFTEQLGAKFGKYPSAGPG